MEKNSWKNNIPFTAELVQVFILSQTRGSLISYYWTVCTQLSADFLTWFTRRLTLAFFAVFYLCRKKELASCRGVKYLCYLTSLLRMSTYYLCPFPLKGKPGRCLKSKGKTRCKLLPSPPGVRIQPWQPGHIPMAVKYNGSRSYFFNLIIYWMGILKNIKLLVFLQHLPTHANCGLFLTPFYSEHQHFKQSYSIGTEAAIAEK